MGVNSIDTKINLNHSNFSSGLNKAGKDLGVLKTKLDGVSTSTLALAESYRKLGQLQNLIGGVMSGAYNYATAMESNAVGISGILQSMIKVNGQTLTWNQSMAKSRDIMAKLREEALQTSATSTDLIETFRGILGPALNQGMSIENALDFSKVGVNAVRSLGLPSNQYLQELRSILQGNIRPASSTLATALGITNQDIKNAKSQVGGVYKFLMDRMEGFVRATDETAKTVKGRLAIIQEGLYATVEKAGKEVYDQYNGWLKEIIDKMFVTDQETKRISLRQEFVDGVKEIADSFVTIGKYAGKLFTMLSSNAGGILKTIEMFAMFKGGQIITNSAINMFSGFVNNLKQVESFLNIETAEVRLAKIQERTEKITLQAKEQNDLEKQKNLILDSEISRLEKIASLEKSRNSNNLKVNEFIFTSSKYTKNNSQLGIKAGDSIDSKYKQQALELNKILKEQNYTLEERNKIIIKYFGYIEKGKIVEGEAYANSVKGALASIEAKEKERQETERLVQEELKNVSVKGKLKNLAVSCLAPLGALAFSYQILTGDTQSNVGEMANWVIQAGFLMSAMSDVGKSIGALRDAYNALKESAILARMAQGGVVTAGVVAGAMVVGGAVKKYNDYQKHGNKAFEFDEDSDVVYSRDIEGEQREKALKEAQEKEENAKRMLATSKRLQADALEKYGNFNGDVTLRNPGTDAGGGGGGKGANKIEKLKQQADEAKKSYDELISTINVANAGKDESITEFGKKREELKNKLLQWNDKLDTLKKKGGEYSQISDDDVTKAKTLIEQYKLLETEEINRNEKIKEYANELQIIDNLETVGALSKREANKLRVESLQEEIAFYQQLASQEKLNADKRLEYETIIAEKRKALREAEATESKIQWDSVLEHIRNTSFNLTETFNGGIDTMIGRFTEFGQNIIGSTKSVTEQIKELCKNLASDILNMMMKIYMQGIMMNLIGNIFGGGAGTKAVNGAMGEFAGGTYYNATVFPHANGGVAKGWSLVGEKGPELVNFSNPGRVYTADQTRNALSGGGGVNIKIDLHNESGTQVEAQTTGSTFDGENYVVGVVLKAISTNKNGMRNIIKGVATT